MSDADSLNRQLRLAGVGKSALLRTIKGELCKNVPSDLQSFRYTIRMTLPTITGIETLWSSFKHEH